MNITKWETCSFGHPNESGVYAICSSNYSVGAEHILYIGSTENLSKRLSSMKHPYRIALKRMPVYVRFLPCQNYRKVESVLLKKHKPIMNIKIPK